MTEIILKYSYFIEETEQFSSLEINVHLKEEK